MPAHPIIRSTLVTALAAWMLLCCCERRIYADTLLGALGATDAACATAEAAAPACCPGCAGGDEGRRDGRSEGEPEPPCCGNGCCDKAAAPAPDLAPAVDTVGVAIAVPHAAASHVARPGMPRAVRDGRCRPPPWRTLIETARLRI